MSEFVYPMCVVQTKHVEKSPIFLASKRKSGLTDFETQNNKPIELFCYL